MAVGSGAGGAAVVFADRVRYVAIKICFTPIELGKYRTVILMALQARCTGRSLYAGFNAFAVVTDVQKFEVAARIVEADDLDAVRQLFIGDEKAVFGQHPPL